MKVFVAALDAGSLAGAGRTLGKSPAAVSRAIAFLEAHVGAELLHRTTRSIKLSEAGERYAIACRRMLSDLEEADMIVAGERSAPRGLLSITSPVAAGEDVLRPIIDAFMDEYPAVNVRLYLLDRPASLIDEGIDLALRIAHLADSTLIAVRVGEVRRVVAAAPRYLATEGTEPGVDRVTAEQKAAIYKGVTQVLSDVLKKPPEWTWVVFQEVELEDWGWGGVPVAAYRKQMQRTSG
ncbi:LysR family transcriptional regulator [Roseiterribacter gracilis]